MLLIIKDYFGFRPSEIWFQTALDLLGEGLVNFLIELGEIGFANVGFEDVTVFVDQDGSRVNLCTKGFRGSFVGIVHDGEGNAVFFDVLMDALNRVDGLGNCRGLGKFLTLIILGGFDDLGISLTQPGQEGNQKLMRVTLSFKSALVMVLPCRSGRAKSGAALLLGIRTKVRSAPIVATMRSVNIFS